MKKILLLALIILIFNHCDNDNKFYPVDASRQIINETNHNLEITMYNDLDTFQFNLAPRSTFIVEADCIDTPFDEIFLCVIGWDVLRYANIVFDNERIQRFELEENLECSGKAINGSIWSPECGYQTNYNKNLLNAEYRIIQEDYDNADIL